MALVVSTQRVVDMGAHAMLRHMDLFMYVLYSGDEVFVMDMVRKVVREVCDKFACPELAAMLAHADRPLMYRCLFFFMVNFYKDFRFWALQASLGLQPVCPHKATRFLLTLKNELVPNFLLDERVRLEEFERAIKVAYICS